jgi:hypothetical protein
VIAAEISDRLVPTRHAREVLVRRSVSWDEVVETVASPEVVEPHEGRTRYTRGPLCAVVAEDRGSLVLVTVLLRSCSTWSDESARSRISRPAS